MDDLIDVIEGNRKYVKCLYVYNKIDVCTIEEVDEIARRPNSIPVSCSADLNLDDGSPLRSAASDLGHDGAGAGVHEEDGQQARLWGPGGAERGPGRDDAEALSASTSIGIWWRSSNYGLVWGTSSKHMPQRCGLSHRLDDEDVVQLVKKKVIGGSRGAGDGSGRGRRSTSGRSTG